MNNVSRLLLIFLLGLSTVVFSDTSPSSSEGELIQRILMLERAVEQLQKSILELVDGRSSTMDKKPVKVVGTNHSQREWRCSIHTPYKTLTRVAGEKGQAKGAVLNACGDSIFCRARDVICK